MVKLTAITFAITALALACGAAWAETPANTPASYSPHGVPHPMPENVHVTPYGDFCPNCTKYGAGHHIITPPDAVAAMQAYFSERGFNIRNVLIKGRFMRADVYKDDQMVDRVVFDRMTGRLRSVY